MSDMRKVQAAEREGKQSRKQESRDDYAGTSDDAASLWRGPHWKGIYQSPLLSWPSEGWVTTLADTGYRSSASIAVIRRHVPLNSACAKRDLDRTQFVST